MRKKSQINLRNHQTFCGIDHLSMKSKESILRITEEIMDYNKYHLIQFFLSEKIILDFV